ncbi:MAG: hypothetical protein MK102_12760 [Fuerstiella sp.]|nr:hypothetical protein [Fuerstiella sp.]
MVTEKHREKIGEKLKSTSDAIVNELRRYCRTFRSIMADACRLSYVVITRNKKLTIVAERQDDRIIVIDMIRVHISPVVLRHALSLIAHAGFLLP